MAYIPQQVGPYSFFKRNSLGNGVHYANDYQIRVNNLGTLSKVKQVCVNNSGSVNTVKQIWANDGGVLKMVYPNQTTVIDLIDGAYTYQGDYNASGTQVLQLRFTMNGQNVYFPAGWTGKISYWQGNDMSSPPTNTSDNYSWLAAIQSERTAYSRVDQWGGSGAVIHPNTATYQPAPQNGVIATHLGQSNTGYTNTPHRTSYVSTNGTPFSFTGYHDYPALATPWYGITIVWDGERSKGDTLYVQQYRKLRLAVTSTGSIFPMVG